MVYYEGCLKLEQYLPTLFKHVCRGKTKTGAMQSCEEKIELSTEGKLFKGG